MPNLEEARAYERRHYADYARNQVFVQFELLTKEEQIRQQYQEHLEAFAEALMGAGLNLIPSDVLADNQIVVSRAVFDKAKDLVSQRGER